ncbi:cold shock domain-containing protein [Vibrio crassostreae]|uniref:cold shock domain-containing protein n=1 Tax=Vibrio crassostreae TaxID=246167 RepID=UPI0010EFF7FC|nr:cold-shock-like DNA binding protein [Vibrio crassostreae]
MYGKVTCWVSGREFGLIQSDKYQGDIFIHMSDFTNLVRQPRVGDIIEFQLITNKGIASAKTASIVYCSWLKINSFTLLLSNSLFKR